MDVRRLIAIRHGQTDWNAAGRFQGQTDIPMNAEGERQVKEAAVHIAALEPTGMVSSDLGRAAETAQAIADAAGISFSVDSRLREIFVGTWEGLTREEIEERFPQEWERWNAGEDIARGGGETRSECAQRVGSAMADIIADTSLGNTVVIVGHGMALRAALTWLDERAIVRLDEPAPRMANAAFVVADIL